MALPIAPTPTLKGKDAKRFLKLAKENETKMASKEELDACVKAYLAVVRNDKTGLL